MGGSIVRYSACSFCQSTNLRDERVGRGEKCCLSQMFRRRKCEACMGRGGGIKGWGRRHIKDGNDYRDSTRTNNTSHDKPIISNLYPSSLPIYYLLAWKSFDPPHLRWRPLSASGIEGYSASSFCQSTNLRDEEVGRGEEVYLLPEAWINPQGKAPV